MRYYRVRDIQGETHLATEQDGGTLVSLTSINEEVRDFRDLLRASYISGQSVDEIASNVLSRGGGATFDLQRLVESSQAGTGNARLLAPLEPDEMWAGGIGNYPVAPDAVANMPEATRIAFESDRPPVMYKGTASRLVGPFDRVGIRSDTERTVAEGELVLVIYKGRLVAYSTGNEMAGGLMGQTIWWMAPSKVFKGCASLGPCVVTPESLPNPGNLKVELSVTRDGQEVDQASSVTAHRRPLEDLVGWTVAHDSPPDLAVLYTGGCVASANTTLQAGDVVRISTEGIGFVENTVEVV